MTDNMVTPLFLSLAVIFLGTALASKPRRDAFIDVHEPLTNLAMLGGVLGALASVAIALVPVFGRVMLPVGTLFLVGSLAVLSIKVWSWVQAVSRAQVWRWFALAMALGLLNFVLPLLLADIALRLSYQVLLATLLLGSAMVGLWRMPVAERSRQSALLMACVVVMWLLIVAWSWAVYVNASWGGVMVLGRNVSEPWVGFLLRLFVFGCLLVAYVSANGCALDRMVRLTLKTYNEKQDTQRLNTQLQQLLNEKQAMLQTISFAARHQNFPAIMSSLNHEISQPLGALRLNAEYLQDDDPTLSAQERHAVLEQLVVSSQQVHQVVQDFRRFFNAAQGQATVFALDVLLTDVLRALSSEFGRLGVGQQRGVLTPAWVRGDAVQLESAISGLVHFLLARLPVDASPRFFVELVVDAGFAHLRLLTNGPQLQREEYERALSRVSADAQSGFNRHVWLARAIVENHSGAMNVYADELWSGVCVQLPVSGSEE